MEKAIRGYFDACNAGDADAVAAYFAPGAVHYFPPTCTKGRSRRARHRREVAWRCARSARVDRGEVICDPGTDRR